METSGIHGPRASSVIVKMAGEESTAMVSRGTRLDYMSLKQCATSRTTLITQCVRMIKPVQTSRLAILEIRTKLQEAIAMATGQTIWCATREVWRSSAISRCAM
jgi:hypothetical protein